MNVYNRIISTTVLTCFIVNTAVSDLALAQNLDSKSGQDKLAVVSRFDDMLGKIELQDMARIEMTIEDALLKAVGEGRKIDIKTLKRNAIEANGSIFKGPIRFEQYHHNFINEVKPLRNGYYRVMCRVSDKNHFRGVRERNIRTYYAVFPAHADDLDGFPVEVYTESEWLRNGGEKFINDSLELTGNLPRRSSERPKDAEAMRRYEKDGEKIDKFIRALIEPAGREFAEIENRAKELGWDDLYRGRIKPKSYWPRQLLDSINKDVSRILSAFGLSLDEAFKGKNIVFLKVPKGVKLPVIKFGDREIEVSCHTSNNAVYLFIEEEAYDFIESCVRENRPIPVDNEKRVGYVVSKMFHEAGVAYGLYPKRLDSGGFLSDLDMAGLLYTSLGIRKEEIVQQFSGLNNLRPVDLDILRGTNAAGEEYERDYAWSHKDLEEWNRKHGRGLQRRDREGQQRKAAEKSKAEFEKVNISGETVEILTMAVFPPYEDHRTQVPARAAVRIKGPDQMIGKGFASLGNRQFEAMQDRYGKSGYVRDGDEITMIFGEHRVRAKIAVNLNSRKVELTEVKLFVPQAAPTLRADQVSCKTGTDVAGRFCWKILIEGENEPIYIHIEGTSAEAAERLNAGLGKFGFKFTDLSPEGSPEWRRGDTKIRGYYHGREVDLDLIGPSTSDIERFIRGFLETGISAAMTGPGVPKGRTPSRPAPDKIFDSNPLDVMMQDARDGLRDLTPWGPRLMPDPLRPKGFTEQSRDESLKGPRSIAKIEREIRMVESVLNNRQNRLSGLEERISQERRETSNPKSAREKIKIFKQKKKNISKEIHHLVAQKRALMAELESSRQARPAAGKRAEALPRTNIHYYDGNKPPTEFGASGPQFDPDSNWNSVETVPTYTPHKSAKTAESLAQAAVSDYESVKKQYTADGFITPDEATKELNALTILRDEKALEKYYEKAEQEFTKQEFLDGLSAELKKVDQILRRTRPIDELNALMPHGVGIKQLDILRAASEIILQLLPEKAGVDNIERLKQIREVFVRYPELSKLLVQYFEARFDPKKDLRSRGKGSGLLRIKTLEILDRHVGNPEDRKILHKAMSIMIATEKTDYYVEERTGLFLRIHPRSIVASDESKALVQTPPFAIIWVHTPYGAFGAHSRYTNIARGGLRCISPERVDSRNKILSECVQLSITQDAKHSDIPEGGSKGTFVYNQGLNGLAAAMGYIDGLINCALIDDRIAVASGAIRVDPLELGPDESTDILANLITARAYMKKLKGWRVLMTGKSTLLGGVPHKSNNLLEPAVKGNRVTSQGVMEHAAELVRYCREKGIIKSAENEPLTLSITGGFDGDVASGEMERSVNRWGDNAKIRSYVDKTGVVIDPLGIPREAVSYAYEAGLTAEEFPREKLSAGGFAAKAVKGSAEECYTTLGSGQLQIMNTRALDPDVLNELGLEERYKKQAGLKVDEPLIVVLERDAEGRPAKVRAHNIYLKDALFFLIKADMLITGGGVRNSIDNKNWQLFFDWDGKPVCQAITHGANVFIEEEASVELEKRGVVIEPDEKANSVGVETSSRVEVDFNTIFDENEGTKALMTAYFEQSLGRFLENARWKFWALRMEAEDRPNESVVTTVSPAMSSEIIELFEFIMNSDIIGDRRESYNGEVVERLRRYFPELGVLDNHYRGRPALGRVFDRMPVERLRMIASKLIAKEAVLNLGMGAVRILVKESGATEIDVIKAYLAEANRLKVYENVKSVIDNKENLLPSEQIKALKVVRKYLKDVVSARLSVSPQPAAGTPKTASLETEVQIEPCFNYTDLCDFLLNSPRSPLDEREKKVLTSRHILPAGKKRLTLEKTGKIVGCNTERARQLEARAVAKAKYVYEHRLYEPVNLNSLDTESVEKLAFFSKRVRDAFGKLGITSIEGLCRISGEDLLGVGGFGAASLSEVREALWRVGLTLRDDGPIRTAAAKAARPAKPKPETVVTDRTVARGMPDGLNLEPVTSKKPSRMQVEAMPAMPINVPAPLAQPAITEVYAPLPMAVQVAADGAKIRNVTPPAYPLQLPEGFSADIWQWWPGNEGYAIYMTADHNTRATLKAGGIWAVTGPRRAEAPKQANVVLTEFDNAATPTPELILQSQPAAAEGVSLQSAESTASAKEKFDPKSFKEGPWSQFEYRLDQTGKVVSVEPRRIPSWPEERLPGQSDRGEEYAFDLRLGAQADRSAMARLSELQGRLKAVISDNLKLCLLPLESYHIALAGRYPELNLEPLSDDLINEAIENVRKYVDRTGLDKFTITISGLRRNKNDISIVLGLIENPLLGQLRGDILKELGRSGWKVEKGEEKGEVRINKKDGKPNPGGHITIGKMIPGLEGSDVLMSENEVEKLDAKVSKIDEELRAKPISIDFDVISFSHPTREFLFAGWDREILIPLGRAAPAIPVDIPTLSERLQTRVRYMTKLAGKVAKEIAPPVQNYTIFASYDMLNDEEHSADAKEYADRFGLVRIMTNKPDETVDWMLRAVKDRGLNPENVIAQLPVEFADDLYKGDLERLAREGIRYMIIDTAGIKDESPDDRKAYRTNIYAQMLLARAISADTEIGSPLYRLLRFFIESHVVDFKDKAALIDQYIDGLKKSQFINMVLSYKPVERYDAVKEYNAVAVTLMSA